MEKAAHLMTSDMFGTVADGLVLPAAKTWKELCTEKFETFVAKGM